VNAGSQPRNSDVDVEGCRQPYKVLLETEVDDLLCTMFYGSRCGSTQHSLSHFFGANSDRLVRERLPQEEVRFELVLEVLCAYLTNIDSGFLSVHWSTGIA
jgi:hypothetical protein